jgi:hypothetical protein
MAVSLSIRGTGTRSARDYGSARNYGGG